MGLPKTIDPDARYRITLSGVAEHGGKRYSPGRKNIVRGKILEAIKDKVTTAAIEKG
ncbi:hypothetical protein GGD81_001385 [Rhodobium orientis]|uniref:hypothetical protein n=1 Tax=Rhodobium orientis TaxID=34017 RepID=UPI00147272BD|nr:hypothetical protein [Rhodobium orientis]MBB4302358.1 hypothetical protein [Rhodobium orientis]